MKKMLPLILFLLTSVAQAQSPRYKRSIQLQTPVEDQSEIKPGERIDDKIKQNFFLKAEVSKTSCYVGEPLMATYKAFSRLNANLTVVKRPAFTGFSVLEMVDGYGDGPDVELVKGKAFNSHLIRKAQLFPLQAGTFSLEVAEVEARIFLQNPITVKDVSVRTSPIEVTVKPLPEKNQPDSFSGAVGNFSVELQMNGRDLFQFEPAIVKLVITGTGNFPLITDPDIVWPKGLEVSSPQVLEDVNRYAYPLSGSKIFEYHVDASHPGEYTIPSIRFSYFDPTEAKYKNVATKEIKFTVHKGNKKTPPSEKIISNPRPFPLEYLYFGVVVAGIIGWIIFQVFRSKRK